jgi:hypothetical protein
LFSIIRCIDPLFDFWGMGKGGQPRATGLATVRPE